MTTDYRVVHGGSPTGIGAILPAGVVAVEARGPVPPDAAYDGERALVARAVESRRLEHARGRSCARRALALLDVAPAPILSDESRAPIWPEGIVGSITHCRDVYCCSAVGHASAWAGIGIDAELLRPLELGVQEKILVPGEQQALRALDPAVAWPCVVFAIKEAIYKALFPRLRRWIDFHEVEVTLDPARGTFGAVGPTTLEGRFLLDGELVLAAVVQGSVC